MPNFKVYFMVGLPTDTHDDVKEIVALCKKGKHRFLQRSCGKKRLGHIKDNFGAETSAYLLFSQDKGRTAGIAPKICKQIKNEKFMRAFTAKGSFATLFSEIPIKGILKDKTALLEAAIYSGVSGYG